MNDPRPGTVPARSAPAVTAVKPIEDTIALVEESGGPADRSKIRAFGMASANTGASDWKRSTYSNKTGAVRVKSFHGRLSDQGMEYLDHAVNDWMEHHPEVEIKFVTSNVGLFEGKLKELALVVNLWY